LTGIVVDASITASWLLPDEANDFALAIYNSRDRIDIHVPAIWEYESRNILIINQRRGRITMEAADAAFEFLMNLDLNIDNNNGWNDTVDLARRFALTIYDAAYLELALRLDTPLATLDKALIAAATQSGRLADGGSLTP
jgi:predicted nucleic acid-binding protein